MSQYNEDGKKNVAEALEEWLLRNRRMQSDDINIHLHPDREAYVTIELEHRSPVDEFKLSTERIRSILDDKTDEKINFVEARDTTLRVSVE